MLQKRDSQLDQRDKLMVWLVSIRALSSYYGDRDTKTQGVLVLSMASNEKALIQELLAKKFTREWWAEHLVTDVECRGEVWADLTGGRGGLGCPIP